MKKCVLNLKKIAGRFGVPVVFKALKINKNTKAGAKIHAHEYVILGASVV